MNMNHDRRGSSMLSYSDANRCRDANRYRYVTVTEYFKIIILKCLFTNIKAW